MAGITQKRAPGSDCLFGSIHWKARTRKIQVFCPKSATKVTPTLSKQSEKLLTVMLAIMSPLLLIGLMEGAAYLWERAQANGPYAWELVASRRMDWVQYREPGSGYTLMQPGSHYQWQGIPVDINSHGLRSPETTYEKPPATFRILNLGDSVVMGWECARKIRTDGNWNHY